MPALAGYDDDDPAESPGVQEVPPWGDSQGQEEFFDNDGVIHAASEGYDAPAEDRGCMAQRKQGAFMAKLEGPVTRQQAIEFINLQRWAREGFSTFMYVSILWLSFLTLVDLHSHIKVSYEMYSEVTSALDRVVAAADRGIAPNAIFSMAGESVCSCSCPGLCDQSSIPGGQELPGVPTGAFLFNGTVLPEQLQTMRAKSQFLRNLGKPVKTIKLSEVNSIPDVWFWLQHGLIPELWHEEARSNPVNTTLLFGDAALLKSVKGNLKATEKPGHFMRWNQVIGGVRLRQRRLHVAGCRAGKVSDRFDQKCHKRHDSVMPFGPGTIAYADGFVPDEKERGAFDIYLDTERPVHIALETLQFMLEAHHWLDASTKSLQVQVPIINVEVTPALYGLIEIRFDFTRSGDLTKKVDIWTSAANPYSGFSLVYLADAVWVLLLTYLLFKKVWQAIKYFVKVRERHDVLCNFWYLFDWATILCGFAILGSWIYTVNETTALTDVVTTLSEAPSFDASDVLIKSYHAHYGDALDRTKHLMNYRERLRLAQFGYSMMLIFQFIKAFRGQPKLAQLTRTLINACEDLTHWLACFIVLFLTFAFSGHLVFGLRLEEWSTSTKCVNSAFRALKGDLDLLNMYEVAPITTMIWFWLFLVLMIFTMMNLLLATVYDHYQLVKVKANAFTGVGLQFKDALRDLWKREGFKMFFCGCCCRCRRRDDLPSHEDMLENLMARAGYNPTEKHHVFRTVLGPKWMRKKTEKHVFAGEVSAEHIKLDEQQPAEDDLKQLGVDPDYIQALLEGAENYREREFDPEELHTNQLRELVTLAEIEMAAMRRRLDNCQGHMRLTMHDLARRLEHLERATHSSLADLVYLAGAAGISDRTEHEAQMETFENSASGCHKSAALTSTYRRVMTHLGSGSVKRMKDERARHQADVTRMHDVRQQNDTYARIHTNARLAMAYGSDELRRQARKHNMHL